MSLPSELDFELDREASPARMNRAMEYLYLLAKAGVALQPQFATAIAELNGVGLSRLDQVLTPIFHDAQAIAAALAAIEQSWLTGDPLESLLEELQNSIDAALAGNATSVAGQLASSNAAVAAVNAALAGLSASIGTLTAADTALTSRINAERARMAIISGGI